MDMDDQGAQKMAMLIVSMLVFATACVMFSCYRIMVEKYSRKKQQRVALSEDEPSRIYSIVGEAPQNSYSTITEQSDRQLIFGAPPLNTSTSEVFAASINQDNTIRHRPLTELQIEYEQRAQQRRNNLYATDFVPAPPYNPKDESLPSYDQALRSPVNHI